MNSRIVVVLIFVGMLGVGFSGAAGEDEGVVSLSEKVLGMVDYEGFFPFYWEESTGKIWLEIGRWGSEFLYVTGLSAGLGSNDIGLDRGQLGQERIVRFERVGPKVLLVQPNYAYRAESESAAERKAVADAFAQSILWGFSVAAEEDGRVLVDATTFLLRDAHGVAGTLRRSNQGDYTIDETRSAVYLDRTKNFLRNTEWDIRLTFTGSSPGALVRSVAPDGAAVTVRQHHSFVALPDEGYTRRKFDPRAGANSVSYYDYATAIDEPLEKRWVHRHRLAKKDPSAAMSDPVEPIVYYLDPGTPEPIRSALLEGARWWNQAFEAAGYRDAFQVEMLPEDADPLDVRYNIIQWVHRSTRGWSYGGSVTDPRTGEIIKGIISLGSLRVRQDFLIASGLVAPYGDGGDTRAMQALALARLRQLSAHEVGHTIGFAHNFIASTAGRASVMDYPHPLIRIDADGGLDLSDAYDDGIGAWDKIAVAHAYQDFPEGTDEGAALEGIIQDGLRRGYSFLSDQDARQAGSAHPEVHLWDNGADAADELTRVLSVRAIALGRFSEANIAVGAPLATLEEVLTPLYLFHRYQVEAAMKVVGGLTYSYALRGDNQVATSLVDGAQQRKALGAVLETIGARALTLPEHIIGMIPPRSYEGRRHREIFNIRTGLGVDPIAMAETAADLTVHLLLNPQRAARLLEHHAREVGQPSLGEVLDGLLDATWFVGEEDGLSGEVLRAVNGVVLTRLLGLAANADASTQVRAVTHKAITGLRGRLRRSGRGDWAAHRAYAMVQIDRYLENPDEFAGSTPVVSPPGSPIGSAGSGWCSTGL